MHLNAAWILPTALTRPSLSQFRPCFSSPRFTSHPTCIRRRRLRPPTCTATPPKPFDPRGLNGTAPFYVALVAAQALPFIFPNSGPLGDLTYFTTTAIAALVIGCRRALLQPPSLSAPLSKAQALTAPFVASAFLLGSYLLLKYTDLNVGLLLNGVTTLAGSLCLKEALDPVFHSLLALMGWQDIVLWQQNDRKDLQPFQVTLGAVLATITAVSTTAAYLLHIEPTFVFSNFIAIGICARVLALVRPDSFLVATALLTGLFFYDIFWVFGSEVMVSVATQIDSPGKLLFPRDAAEVANSAVKYPYAILGLGDVCVPGMFVTLAQAMDQVLGGGKEPYFWGAVAAYATGLLTCFGVNLTTHAAQPALLYLVPAMVVGVLGVGWVRGEVREVIGFKLDDKEDSKT